MGGIRAAEEEARDVNAMLMALYVRQGVFTHREEEAEWDEKKRIRGRRLPSESVGLQ
jgi:hypothetical protein